ncbi:acyl-CoA ligase (AMP-forming), exosortase A system-associated [Mycolicibacterium fluoranthenivorans]|uniref:Acyl-CoA ligase (AMP-forming), exosortase A-associated n=1 Tax=Mycolicibacterium fluoranthenivorans TaxID=258505 RepID=A0A1G4VI64_9MYCO|nr:acyl-CoA ligase (AMP-forming), exosortase A system-associated [Mycolicibacterium fluoranthenivorans]SCX07167.1 acyl-CoA ligase (AMP-forming), exosortase A-associated [Mycolicibacterium fluoranthenivorans]
MRANVHHLIEQRAQSDPTAPALTVKKQTVDYWQLWRRTHGAAAGLRRIGVTSGQRVAVYLDKRVETVAALFGASVAGGVFVPVNHVLRPAQVGHIVADCAATVLVTSAQRLALLGEQLANCLSLEHVIVVGAGAAQDDTPHHWVVHSWAELCAPEQAAVPVSGAIDHDIAAIFYTSGSTGQPKGVVLSHRNLIAGAESVAQYLQNSVDDVILAVLPLSFDAGFSQLTTAFSAGAHVVLMDYLLPADVPRLCAEHRVTGLTCVPPLWIQIVAQQWPPEATTSMRYFASTGGRMPKPTLDRLRALFPAASPYLMYGLTEAFRSTYLDPAEVDRRPDSIGKAIPNARIVVLRPDGSVCDPGEEGELVHRGALVALGYWNDPVRTAERFKPIADRGMNWRATELAVWSGDTVFADEDGYLYFVGRADEMIKTSGYRVSPAEIEDVVYATGRVRDTVAFGVADEDLGQRIHLVVTPAVPGRFDAPALIAELVKRVPRYMIPSSVSVCDDIPRSPNGKFDRARLREELGP